MSIEKMAKSIIKLKCKLSLEGKEKEKNDRFILPKNPHFRYKENIVSVEAI